MRMFWLSTAIAVALLALNAWLFGFRGALNMAASAGLVAAVLLAWFFAIAWYVERKTARRKRRRPEA